MATPASAARPDLDAGNFSLWLAGLHAVLRGEGDSDVPCGACTACCRSSQFIHIAPDETETLARIPHEVVFPAPGQPVGTVVMGYDEYGHCPMFANGECSIYTHRPRTCRVYDCRVFPATNVDISSDKPLIGAQARRWKFTFGDDDGRRRQVAVDAAATYLRDHHGDLPPEAVPTNPTQLAVRAIEMCDDVV